MNSSFVQQRLNMLEGQIRPFSVFDTKVLGAYKAVPREAYVDQTQQGLAYLGGNLPVGGNRYLIDPAAHARLLQALEIIPGDNPHVLDVGCLSGYTTALLAELTPNVLGVDDAAWVAKAAALASSHAKFIVGDLTDGAANYATPFDIIVVNGAIQHVPQALVAQLKEGGKLATFYRGAQSQLAYAVIYHKNKGALREQILFDAFVPLLQGFEASKGFAF